MKSKKKVFSAAADKVKNVLKAVMKGNKVTIAPPPQINSN